MNKQEFCLIDNGLQATELENLSQQKRLILEFYWDDSITDSKARAIEPDSGEVVYLRDATAVQLMNQAFY